MKRITPLAEALTTGKIVIDVDGIEAEIGGGDKRTGWRLMPLVNGWTGALYMKRVGTNVFMKAEGLNGSAASSAVVALVPPGFQSEGSINERGLLHSTSSAVSRWWCGTDAFSSPNGLGNLYGSGSWDTTDAWPLTLPGSNA